MILQAGFVFDIEGGIKEEKGKHVICLKNEKWRKNNAIIIMFIYLINICTGKSRNICHILSTENV